MGVVQGGLRARVTEVAVVGGAGHPPGGRAVEHLVRVVGLGVLTGRRGGDVARVGRPVVVVRQDPGPQARRPQRRSHRLDELDLLRHRQIHARVGVRLPVLRLVLHREVVDRYAGGLVGLDELDEVPRVRRVDAGVVLQPSADEGVGGLHPRRRAPRGGDHGQPRVQRLGPAQQREDLRLVVGDAEVRQREVGLSGGHVVVGVVRLVGEVRGADRLAQRADPDALCRIEQAAHRLLAGRRIQPVEHGGRGVGDRRPEPVHGLVRPARVDRDRELTGRPAAERDGAAVVQQLGPVGRGDPHSRGGSVTAPVSARGRRRNDRRGQRDSTQDDEEATLPHQGALRSERGTSYPTVTRSAAGLSRR